MNEEEVIKLAHKATGSEIILGTLYEAIKDEYVNIYLMSFAKLIAKKEREACAKACEKEKDIDGISTAKAFAEIIRARKQE